MTRRGKAPKFMQFGLPPTDVLEGSICDSTTSYLFDQMVGEHERPPSREYRHAQARNICNGTGGFAPCPVRAQCLVWALENEELGVYGGHSVSTRMVNRYKRKQIPLHLTALLVKESA